ncbi:hypothetical protein QR680_004887 [Steinernema hermaphroditum]|uniref:FYVE-type domain-containing protein n=1 Tax=Steinernema hermaphroditum TaxID=289476 RepID=A0AA39LTX7_9BILA|nr:hypothetical protein QR680_004887 [Steinernema hermaphroditum]
MPCTSCMASYSLLRKELACANCGFGFCANCLKHSWTFPARSKKPLNVCAQCFHQLSESAQRSPGKMRTPAANGNCVPVVPSSSLRGDGGGVKSEAPNRSHQHEKRHEVKSSSSTEALRARLEKLKEDEKKTPMRIMSLQEIEERFAALREVPVEDIRNPGRMFLEGNGKQEETASDLIKRISDEQKLEEKWDRDQMLQDRYNRLCDVEKTEPEASEVADQDMRTIPESSTSTFTKSQDDFDISNELDAVKRALEKCDSAEKPSDPAKNNWKDDDYDMKQILKDVKELQKKEEKINRAMSRDLSDDSELDSETDDPMLNDEVQKILKEAEKAGEETAKLVRVSRAENPPAPEDPPQNGSPQKKSGFFSRMFKR